MVVRTPADERRHPPGTDDWFHEEWAVDFSRPDGTGGSVRLGLYPNQQIAWYWAHLVTPDHGLVAVRDHEVPLPRGEALEVRADGLWAELVCETPLEHWGYGLEAFGVRLDEPGDAYRGEIGERLAVGLDLEWEATTPVADFAPGSPVVAHYEQAGFVHGDLLIGRDRIGFEGIGERAHRWGPRDWWQWGWHAAAFQIGEALAVSFVQADESEEATGFVWRMGETSEPITSARVETHLGVDDVPTAARYVINHELEVDVEVVAAAPVPLVASDGRTARLPRALCRYTTAAGTGTGWSEWLQIGKAVAR